VALSSDAIQQVLRQFVLIVEDNLRPPKSFTVDDLTEFLSGTPEAWAGYAAGLPVPRQYKAAQGRSLSYELRDALQTLENTEPNRKKDARPQRRSMTLTLPCFGGSGATTLLRAAAFQAAADGYPTLLLRPGVTDIDLEVLEGFATALTELALGQGLENMPPLAVILDVEAADLPTARHLAGGLAARGRPVVVLRAVPGDRQQSSFLPPLRSESTKDEAKWCEEAFTKLVRQWKLPIDPLPTIEEWLAYEAHSKWTTPTGSDASQSLFWVALRFFLTSGLGRSDAESVHNALGQWIAERDDQVTDEGLRKLLLWVAALSSQRIVCPLAVALRPITGGAFSSSFVPTLQQLADLVDWQDYSADFGDYTIRFRHPMLGEEYLRRRVGLADPATAVHELTPLLEQLVPGRPADRWLADRLVTQVLTPSFQDRSRADWGWRLEGFNRIPNALAMDSRSILHHWARCLYQSADPRNDPAMPAEERRRRTQTAIRYLRHALDLPRRQPREEHPSHLWNTLGVACSRLGRLLDDADPTMAKQVWDDAWEAFRKSIDMLPGNIEALLAFSHRLLDHTGLFDGQLAVRPTDVAVNDVAWALSLLDEAEELIDQAQDPDPELMADLQKDRTCALAWLGHDQVARHLRELKASADPELGFYCEAQLVAQQASDTGQLDRAIGILDSAARVTQLGVRSLRLQLALLRRHPVRQYEFDRLLELHDQLERAAGPALQPVERFRQAVLCFQVEKFPEGEGRFRRLRELARRGDLTPPAVRDIWRQPASPDDPRPTHVRVSRFISQWRADGYADELGLTIPLRPRHFTPMPRLHDVVSCYVRFEFNGPLAIPKRFVGASSTEPRQ